MKIDAIQNGIVIDHITAGKGMEIYNLLKLYKQDCPIELLMNASSEKMGKKDIIKLNGDVHIAMDALGYVDPNATVAVIRDGKVAEKRSLALPKKLTNVIKCKNPRCITTTEQELAHVFVLTDAEKHVYRCMYCETQASK